MNGTGAETTHCMYGALCNENIACIALFHCSVKFVELCYPTWASRWRNGMMAWIYIVAPSATKAPRIQMPVWTQLSAPPVVGRAVNHLLQSA
jgi:hypothetical protein